ncbi:hypothetical protein BGP75_01110 [Motiliproteus sp. MSK22-1]|nr:hypothetical protein BGP75_01110 [Motiliproteus sp. MSK22-1]
MLITDLALSGLSPSAVFSSLSWGRLCAHQSKLKNPFPVIILLLLVFFNGYSLVLGMTINVAGAISVFYSGCLTLVNKVPWQGGGVKR